MVNSVLRYGVVGLGRAGWNIHIAALRTRADSRVVAALDTDPARCQQAVSELGCRVYHTVEELVHDPDVDVVIIANPSHRHAHDTCVALRAGKHVVLEKPMATSLAEADEILQTARRMNRQVLVHLQHRFSQEFYHLKTLVNSGRLGRIFHIRFYMNSFWRRNDWQTLIRYGGGMLNNSGSHYLDMVLQLLGSPARDVMGDLQHIVSAGDAEDHMKAFLRASNGCTADMEISTAENPAIPLPRWIICGTCGTLVNDGKVSTLRWFDPDQVSPIEVVTPSPTERRYGNDDKLPWQEETVPVAGPDYGLFYDNVTAVLQRGATPHVTAESVREVLRVMMEIRRNTGFPGTLPSEAVRHPELHTAQLEKGCV